MSVRIRLTRVGRKNRPHFRIAVFDSRTRRDGRYLENIGHYDPLVQDKKTKVRIDLARLTEWIGKGALPTPSVSQLLKHCGVKVPSAPKTAKPKAEGKPAAKPAAAKPAAAKPAPKK
jgi:small subunit ribosomal protein S16